MSESGRRDSGFRHREDHDVRLDQDLAGCDELLLYSASSCQLPRTRRSRIEDLESRGERGPERSTVEPLRRCSERRSEPSEPLADQLVIEALDSEGSCDRTVPVSTRETRVLVEHE